MAEDFVSRTWVRGRGQGHRSLSSSKSSRTHHCSFDLGGDICCQAGWGELKCIQGKVKTPEWLTGPTVSSSVMPSRLV